MASVLDELPTDNEFQSLPKVDLHIHLNGSISIELLMELSGLSREEVIDRIVARGRIDTFDYINKLDFVNNLLQTKESLYKVSKDLVDRLAKENVIYAEVRFTPMLHLERGLTYDDAIESVIKGLSSNPHVKANLILCMMRGATLYQNTETVKYTSKYLGKGVCALDILGDEELYPLHNYMKLFKFAALERIPYTIHAGRSTDDLYDALILHAKRISNGVKATTDIDLLRFLYYKKILIESSPSNDLMIGEVSNISNHPINFFKRNDFNVCINSDNSTISNISLIDEYQLLSDTFHFTIDNFRKMNLNAINSSFLSKEEKDKYRKLFE
ncbi:MAG: hypothetical protein J6X02_00610 [Bacilli bacterium]|nr:hypothetical protein [Bacilli bacterium]